MFTVFSGSMKSSCSAVFTVHLYTRVLFLSSIFFCSVYGTSFLAPEDLNSPEGIAYAREQLFNRIESVIGGKFRQAAERRSSTVESYLRDTYFALPKNEYGRIDGGAVRFALHRYFVNRHGWSVNGVDPRGDAWNSSLPSAILHGTIAAGASEIFEQELSEVGYSLHETAVLAATMEQLVHEEASDLLAKIFSAENISHSATVNVQQAEQLVEDYTMMIIYGGIYVHKSITSELLAIARRKIGIFYRNWPAMTEFLKDIRKSNELPNAATMYYGFEDVLKIVELAADKQGRWQNVECNQMKNDLVEIEENATGRVSMERFYTAALNGKRQFRENTDYLWMLGSLDKSMGGDPRLIIPNYVMAPANCMAGSNYYKLCCMDECEPLLGHLEKKIGAHEASPAQIASIVSSLPSSTVPAPRDIDTNLLRRLDSIADHHNGMVPLHGRLFSQWMHNAFPRECRYPHLAGTTTQMSLADWKRTSGLNITLTEHQMKDYVQNAEMQRAAGSGGSAAISEWCSKEETIVMMPRLFYERYSNLIRHMASLARVVGLLSVVWAALTKYSPNIKWRLSATCTGMKYPKQHIV